MHPLASVVDPTRAIQSLLNIADLACHPELAVRSTRTTRRTHAFDAETVAGKKKHYVPILVQVATNAPLHVEGRRDITYGMV